MTTTTAPIIDSRNDVRIRRIRRLHTRAERERTGLYYIEGIRFLAQALERRVPIKTVVACPPLLIHPFAQRLVRRLGKAGVPILEVTPPVLHSLALVDDPQGIAAVVAQHWLPPERVQPRNELCWIALDSVQSPGNLGTILRTADAVGAGGLFLLGDSVDPYDPATVRATMGALFSQRFVRTTAPALDQWKAQHGGLLVGTSPSAATDYQAVAYRAPTILLMGGERKGLPAALQARCDVTVRIPMIGHSDSLNLGVATSVLLYEVFNQRRSRPAPPVSNER